MSIYFGKSNDYAARQFAKECDAEYIRQERRGNIIDGLVEDAINETLMYKFPDVPFMWSDIEACHESDLFIVENINLSASGPEAQAEEFIKLRDWILANYRKELTAHYESKSDAELRGE